jgi:hypothetical protein
MLRSRKEEMETMKLNLASIACVLLIFCYAVFGQEAKTVRRRQPTPILSTGTEGETPGAQTASAMIANAVLEALDSTTSINLRECISRNHIPPDEAHKLFLSVQLPAISQTQSVYFVRTDIDHPCRLIGAHAFRYWLVVKSKSLNSATYNVRYSGGSDGVSILHSIHKGMYDIESDSYTGSSALMVTKQFNGSQYVDTICKKAHRTNRGKEVVKIIPCRPLE